MTERRPYPSDLSDARWALIAPTTSIMHSQSVKTSTNVPLSTQGRHLSGFLAQA